MAHSLISRSALREIGNALKRVGVGLFEHNAFDAAAAMSFYFFLGVIPLLAFAGLLVSELVADHGFDDLATPLFRLIPNAAADMISDQLRQMKGTSLSSMAPLSLIGFLSVTSNGVHNLMDVFEVVAQAPPRSWLKQRVIALAGIVILLVALACAASTLFWVGNVLDKAPPVGEHGSIHWIAGSIKRFLLGSWNRLGALLIFTSLAAGVLALFYHVSVKHPNRTRRRIWPGTALGLSAWLIVSWGFAMYVGTIGDYAVYYGSLATVAVFLLWLYLTSLSLLAGAELNAYLEAHTTP